MQADGDGKGAWYVSDCGIGCAGDRLRHELPRCLRHVFTARAADTKKNLRDNCGTWVYKQGTRGAD